MEICVSKWCKMYREKYINRIFRNGTLKHDPHFPASACKFLRARFEAHFSDNLQKESKVAFRLKESGFFFARNLPRNFSHLQGFRLRRRRVDDLNFSFHIFIPVKLSF